MTDSVFVQTMDLGGDDLRVGVKDSIDIEGMPTRLACACFADAPPAERHAEVVRALLDAGCRIVGKTNMHELAYGVTGINRWTGTPVNPRAPERVPGGSSSGSAVAVAMQLVDFAVGTDTGGSIRIPSACCGVYGLKPTYGRVSRSGGQPGSRGRCSRRAGKGRYLGALHYPAVLRCGVCGRDCNHRRRELGGLRP